jgi:hypothetical protein
MHLPEDKVREVVAYAFQVGNMDYGIPEAVIWANDYKVPKDIVDQDMKALEDSGFD